MIITDLIDLVLPFPLGNTPLPSRPSLVVASLIAFTFIARTAFAIRTASTASATHRITRHLRTHLVAAYVLNTAAARRQTRRTLSSLHLPRPFRSLV